MVHFQFVGCHLAILVWSSAWKKCRQVSFTIGFCDGGYGNCFSSCIISGLGN